MVHSFDVEHAQEYGIIPAILIHHLKFWIIHNRANKKHFHDGRTWTFNSVRAFKELFPYLTPKQTRTALETLRDRGVIVTGNYNTTRYDHTLWYAFSDESKWLPRQIDLPETANQKDDEGKTLKETDSNTDSNTDKEPPISPQGGKHSTRAKKPPEIPDDVWEEFLAIRKSKRATVTPLVIAGIKREADKAGITLARAMTICVEKGWQSFDADWSRGSGSGKNFGGKISEPPSPPLFRLPNGKTPLEDYQEREALKQRHEHDDSQH